MLFFNKRFLNTSSHYANEKLCMFDGTRERSNRLCVLRSLHGLPGQRCKLESPRLQQAKHATSANHLVNWDWSVFKCSDTNVVFRTAFCLILVVIFNLIYLFIADTKSIV